MCESHVSSVDSNEMGDGRWCLASTSLRSVQFRQQQPVLWGGIAGYAVDPEPWDAGCAGGCVVPCGCVVAGGEPVCSWA